MRRGAIDVKGKGGMVTYFVDKRAVPAQMKPDDEQAANREQRRMQVEPAAGKLAPARLSLEPASVTELVS